MAAAEERLKYLGKTASGWTSIESESIMLPPGQKFFFAVLVPSIAAG